MDLFRKDATDIAFSDVSSTNKERPLSGFDLNSILQVSATVTTLAITVAIFTKFTVALTVFALTANPICSIIIGSIIVFVAIVLVAFALFHIFKTIENNLHGTHFDFFEARYNSRFFFTSMQFITAASTCAGAFFGIIVATTLCTTPVGWMALACAAIIMAGALLGLLLGTAITWVITHAKKEYNAETLEMPRLHHPSRGSFCDM